MEIVDLLRPLSLSASKLDVGFSLFTFRFHIFKYFNLTPTNLKQCSNPKLKLKKKQKKPPKLPRRCLGAKSLLAVQLALNVLLLEP